MKSKLHKYKLYFYVCWVDTWKLFLNIACKPPIKCLKVSVLLELKHHSGDFFIQVTPLFWRSIQFIRIEESTMESGWKWWETVFVLSPAAQPLHMAAPRMARQPWKIITKEFPFFYFFCGLFLGRLLFGRVPPLWSCSCCRTRTWPRSRRGWTQNCPAIVLLTCQMIFHLFLIRFWGQNERKMIAVWRSSNTVCKSFSFFSRSEGPLGQMKIDS